MSDLPAIEQLAPFLSERGQLELNLAIAHWQIAVLQQQMAELTPADDRPEQSV